MILPRDALIFTVILRLPLVVVIEKLAVELPESIVTVAGTTARYGWLLDNSTTIPSEGAGALSATVPMEVAPPTTAVGLRVKETRTAETCGSRLIAADLVRPS